MILRAWCISAATGIAVIAAGGLAASARDIHVSKAGSDSGSGSQARPFSTINKAASIAQPGEPCANLESDRA